MKRASFTLIIAVSLFFKDTTGTACGPWFPRRYLERGGAELLARPEFFAELELKLLAREFPVPFKAIRDEHPTQRNAERDQEDFDAALRDGSIHPPDPAAARAAHRRTREAIRQLDGLEPREIDGLPKDSFDEANKSVFPSEFADYHAGALACAQGNPDGARKAWERLLTRPAAERRYRSVSAAYMIGVLSFGKDNTHAPKWFSMARDLAKAGFHDSNGLAAASYSCESDWYRARGDLHKAAEHALRSISAGYATRTCIRPAGNTPEELAKFAADPLLRRIVTSLLLGEHTGEDADAEKAKAAYHAWLSALEAADIRNFAGAERAAWMCYDSADYSGAKRWLARAPTHSVESLWLSGKIAAREGCRAESLHALSKAVRLLAGSREPELEFKEFRSDFETRSRNVPADFALAAINVADFRTALDAFLLSNHWEDAAFVAERLLTLEELRAYVVRRPWQDSFSAGLSERWYEERAGVDPEKQKTMDLRWLLARRLARAGRLAEATPFFPVNYRPAFLAYARALARGKDTRLPRDERATAFWAAALEARYHGMELLGTLCGPDWSCFNCDFEFDDPSELRLGTKPLRKRGDQAAEILPIALRPGRAERERLEKSAPTPNKRFHYRYHAADLAWTAAELLPENDQRLAEMLDLTGRWLAPRDPDAADRFYQALESRCAATEIGKRATERHWFVDIETYTIQRNPVEVKLNRTENGSEKE